MTEHKPAAWAWRYEDGGLDLSGMFRTQEACGYVFTGCAGQPVPLYLHPPTLRMPEPMTEDEIVDAFCETPGIYQFIEAFRAGVRFAERRVKEANK